MTDEKKKVNAVLKNLMLDIVGLLGLSSLAYGCYLIYPPVAYIVTGTLILTYICIVSRNK